MQVEREERWLSQRKDDPGLTTKGVKEAEQLGNWLREGMVPGKKATVFTQVAVPPLCYSCLRRGIASGQDQRMNARNLGCGSAGVQLICTRHFIEHRV